MDLDLKVVSKEVNEILWRNHQTLSVAESCTSGRIASVITAVPGSSQYFKGGVIAYANEVKINLLGVDAQIIEEKTPVCEEVAVQNLWNGLFCFCNRICRSWWSRLWQKFSFSRYYLDCRGFFY